MAGRSTADTHASHATGPRPTRAARITAGIVAFVVITVMAVTLLMVLPSGTPLRKEVSSVVSPVLSQNWRVFAPSILKVDRTLEFRAQWRDQDGKLVKSGWVSITDIEAQTIKGNTAPSLVRKNSWNASGTLQQRYNSLDNDQRKRVRDTFIQQTENGFEPIPVETLIEQLGEGDSDVIRYLRLDYMMMRYTTLYATAGFDRDIERVQWRVMRERPNDFHNRFDDEPQFAPTTTTYGWRQSNVILESHVVDEYRALVERMGREHLFTKAADHAE